MVQKLPEYIPLNCYDSSESEDDNYEPGGQRLEEPSRKLSRRRYFADIISARAIAASERKNEQPCVIENNEDDTQPSYQRRIVNLNEPKTIEEFIENLLPDELKGTWTKKKNEEPDAVNTSPYPIKYQTKEARFKLLEREILAWCGGRAIVPSIDALKPDSVKFVNGELDASFEVCLSRIVPLEAKAAKRRAKRKHKKDMEAERLRRDGLLMDVVEHIKDEDVEEMRDSFVSGAELEAMNQCLMDELAAVETELGRKKHLIDVPMSDENGSGSHLDDDGLELTLMRDL